MSIITFLGDVSLLSDSIVSQYSIQGEYVFNLEYVISNNIESFKKHKVNLYGRETDFSIIFGKQPLAVSLANNHIMDCGIKGLDDTLSFLDKSNIAYFGAGNNLNNYNNPAILYVDGIKVALLGYSLFNENISSYGVSFFCKNTLVRDISFAKNQNAEVLIVNIHWGEEESPLYNYEQQKIGRFMIEQGVDLVVGHHPHCIQPFEIYKGKYIFYSIGNCIFPDFKINAFYDEQNYPKRIYRKRQLKHNKISYGVKYDLRTRKVAGIDKLFFHNSLLIKKGTISVERQSIKVPYLVAALIKRKRKYQNFVWSNAFVDGKIFDLDTLRHEISLKKGDVNESSLY